MLFFHSSSHVECHLHLNKLFVASAAGDIWWCSLAASESCLHLDSSSPLFLPATNKRSEASEQATQGFSANFGLGNLKIEVIGKDCQHKRPQVRPSLRLLGMYILNTVTAAYSLAMTVCMCVLIYYVYILCKYIIVSLVFYKLKVIGNVCVYTTPFKSLYSVRFFMFFGEKKSVLTMLTKAAFIQ